MQIGTALLDALKAHGAREMFGIPGDFILPFFAANERAGILPLHTLSHEPSVGFAADAAARLGGRLGVAVVTYGAGALNMVNPVALAWTEKSPVVVISGAPGARERASGMLLHHQVKTIDSQMRIFREITCYQARLDDPATAPRLIAEALQACSNQSMPVYLELPRDSVAQPCAPVPELAQPSIDVAAVGACADELLSRLRAGKRPVIMVGVEVRRFGLEQDVAELTRRLGYPVVTSFLGRGVLAETGVPVLGTYIGVAGQQEVSERVEQADPLVLMGVILSDTNFGAAGEDLNLARSIRACDGRVVFGHHLYPDVPLRELVQALLARTAPQPASVTPPAGHGPRHLAADDAPIAPLDIATAINDLMAATGPLPVACDVSDCLFTAMDIEHTAHVATGYYASMGFGVPAGIGIQAATGQRPIILVGDGGFQMTGWELGHCARLGLDPIVVLMNNRGWGLLRAFEPGARFNDLGEWNFAGALNHLGGDCVRVGTRAELARALNKAQATRGRFQLIEVMLEPEALSPTLRRFATGVKRLSQPAVV